MTSHLLEVVAVAGALGFLALVLELVRRRALAEEYALAWILLAGCALLLAARRGLLDAASQWLGIYYPPAVLLLFLVAFGFGASLYFSVVASRQRRQLEQLTEDTALLEARVRELTAMVAPPASALSEDTGLG